MKVGELFAALSLKKDGFDKGLSGAEKNARGWASKIGSIMKTAALALVDVGVAAGAVAFKLGDMASDMNEARSKVGVVFEKMRGDVEAFAKEAPAALGISETAALSAMGTYGNLFRSMGIGLEKSTDMSTSLLKLSADLASFNNLDPTEVLEKLRAGLVGETEPLRSLGINLNDAMLREKALSMGLVKTTKDVLPAAVKAQAAYALIMEQSTLAQGDFARTADGMANQQRILAATFETTMANVGQAFIPIIQAILPSLTAALQGFADWVTANGPMIQSIIEGVMAGLGTAIGFITDVVIPALGAAFQWWVDNILPIFTEGVNSVGGSDGIMKTLGEAIDFITKTVLPALGEAFTWVQENILPPIKEAFQAIAENVLPILAAAFDTIVSVVKDNWPTISKIVGHVAGFVKTAVEAIANVIKWVAPIIRWLAETIFPILGKAAGFLLTVIEAAFSAIGQIWNTALDIGKKVVDGIAAAWQGLTGAIRTVWNGITGIVKAGANFLIGIVNGIIKAINSIQVHIGKIGLDTPAGFVGVGPFDWNGLNIPELKYLAKGTPWFEGGWAVLGEHGPELARLPKGTRVEPALKTEEILGGGGNRGGAPMIGQQNIYGMQPGDVERETRRAFRRQALDWALEGRT